MLEQARPAGARKRMESVWKRPSEPPYNQRALKVLNVGCGRVGSQIAADMDMTGDDVTIIDRDPNQFSRAAQRALLAYDLKGNQAVGNCTDAQGLRRAA